MITDKKRRSLLLTLGGAVLLISGGIIAWLVLVQRQSGERLPVGATIIPQNALMSVSISTDPKQWQQLQNLGTPETRQVLQQNLAQLERRFLSSGGYSYKAHVQPWVGDQITMAFLPTSASSATATQQSMVWVLPIENRSRARELFAANTLKSNAPKRVYKGVEILELQGENSQKYALSVLDQRYVVLATEVPAMEQMIDTQKGGPSLAQTPRLQTAFDTIQSGNDFAQVYVNLPVAASQTTERAGQSVSPETLANLQIAQGFGSTIDLESEAVRLKAISWLKPGAQKKLEVRNNAQEIVSHLPQSTMMMASGGNFQQFWQEYEQGAASQLAIPFNPNQFRSSVQSTVGMDFEKEFVNWMNSEFAIALVPTAANNSNGAGIVLLAKTTNRKAATQAFKQLDRAVRDRLNFIISESKVGNQTLVNWRVPPGLPVASHGWLDNNTAFLTLGAPVANTIFPKPQASLEQAALFQETTKSELRPNNGHFFVDMSRTLNLMDNSPLLPKFSPNLHKFAQAIQAIGVTAAIRNDWSTRYDVLVNVKKADVANSENAN